MYRVGMNWFPSLSFHGDVGSAAVSSSPPPRDGVENALPDAGDAEVVVPPPPADISSLVTTDDFVSKPVHDMTVLSQAGFNEQCCVLFDDGEVVAVCVVGVSM